MWYIIACYTFLNKHNAQIRHALSTHKQAQMYNARTYMYYIHYRVYMYVHVRAYRQCLLLMQLSKDRVPLTHLLGRLSLGT